MSTDRLISTVLYIGAIFYVIGALVHQLGLTVHPWYVEELHSPYHDALIATSSLIMAVFFVQGARNPSNKQLIDAIMIAAFIGGPLIIAIGLFVDFEAFNAGAKSIQAVIEGIITIALGILLLVLRR